MNCRQMKDGDDVKRDDKLDTDTFRIPSLLSEMKHALPQTRNLPLVSEEESDFQLSPRELIDDTDEFDDAVTPQRLNTIDFQTQDESLDETTGCLQSSFHSEYVNLIAMKNEIKLQQLNDSVKNGRKKGKRGAEKCVPSMGVLPNIPKKASSRSKKKKKKDSVKVNHTQSQSDWRNYPKPWLQGRKLEDLGKQSKMGLGQNYLATGAKLPQTPDFGFDDFFSRSRLALGTKTSAQLMIQSVEEERLHDDLTYEESVKITLSRPPPPPMSHYRKVSKMCLNSSNQNQTPSNNFIVKHEKERDVSINNFKERTRKNSSTTQTTKPSQTTTSIEAVFGTETEESFAEDNSEYDDYDYEDDDFILDEDEDMNNNDLEQYIIRSNSILGNHHHRQLGNLSFDKIKTSNLEGSIHCNDSNNSISAQPPTTHQCSLSSLNTLFPLLAKHQNAKFKLHQSEDDIRRQPDGSPDLLSFNTVNQSNADIETPPLAALPLFQLNIIPGSQCKFTPLGRDSRISTSQTCSTLFASESEKRRRGMTPLSQLSQMFNGLASGGSQQYPYEQPMFIPHPYLELLSPRLSTGQPEEQTDSNTVPREQFQSQAQNRILQKDESGIPTVQPPLSQNSSEIQGHHLTPQYQGHLAYINSQLCLLRDSCLPPPNEEAKLSSPSLFKSYFEKDASLWGSHILNNQSIPSYEIPVMQMQFLQQGGKQEKVEVVTADTNENNLNPLFSEFINPVPSHAESNFLRPESEELSSTEKIDPGQTEQSETVLDSNFSSRVENFQDETKAIRMYDARGYMKKKIIKKPSLPKDIPAKAKVDCGKGQKSMDNFLTAATASVSLPNCHNEFQSRASIQKELEVLKELRQQLLTPQSEAADSSSASLHVFHSNHKIQPLNTVIKHSTMPKISNSRNYGHKYCPCFDCRRTHGLSLSESQSMCCLTQETDYVQKNIQDLNKYQKFAPIEPIVIVDSAKGDKVPPIVSFTGRRGYGKIPGYLLKRKEEIESDRMRQQEVELRRAAIESLREKEEKMIMNFLKLERRRAAAKANFCRWQAKQMRIGQKLPNATTSTSNNPSKHFIYVNGKVQKVEDDDKNENVGQQVLDNCDSQLKQSRPQIRLLEELKPKKKELETKSNVARKEVRWKPLVKTPPSKLKQKGKQELNIQNNDLQNNNPMNENQMSVVARASITPPTLKKESLPVLSKEEGLVEEEDQSTNNPMRVNLNENLTDREVFDREMDHIHYLRTLISSAPGRIISPVINPRLMSTQSNFVFPSLRYKLHPVKSTPCHRVGGHEYTVSNDNEDSFVDFQRFL